MRVPALPRGARRPLLATFLLVAIASFTACSVVRPHQRNAPVARPSSTFERVLDRALGGDAVSQNLAGWMLFTGESAPLDRELARMWFLQAAAQGQTSATLNLAIMHSLGVGAERDWVAAEAYFKKALASENRNPALRLTTLSSWVTAACQRSIEPPDRGQETFETFCAGCHGANGIAEYSESPSFALGERLEKDPEALLQSVLRGHGEMPAWDDILPAEWLSHALGYAHSLQAQFRLGTLHVLNTTPDFRFRFGPMSTDFGSSPTDPSLSYGGHAPQLGDYCPDR